MTDEKLRFIIRDAVAHDVPRCLDIDHSYETEYVWQVNFREDDITRSMTFREERLPRKMEVVYPVSEARLRFSIQPEQCFLVATTPNDDVLGYLTMTPDSTSGIAHLRDIVVARAYRERGVGSRLMTIAQRWAQQHSVHRIIAETQTKNYPAIRLYQQCGYTFCGFNDQYFTNQDIAVFFSQSIR